MVYISEQEHKQIDQEEIPVLLDQGLLRAARQIYNTYCHLHSKLTRNPIGVAIDPKTHRGQVLFTKRPILLPGESFVSLPELQSEIS